MTAMFHVINGVSFVCFPRSDRNAFVNGRVLEKILL